MKEYTISFKEISSEINNLQGKILTAVEVAVTNEQQLKALKDIIKSYISEAHNKIGNTKFSVPTNLTDEFRKVIPITVDHSGTFTTQ